MCHNNNRRNQDIENSHNRNQNSCDLGNLLASSKDADSKGRCQHSADNERRSGRIVEAVCPEGIGDIESRYHVETAHIGNNQGSRKQDSQPSLFQNCLYVVRRSSVGASVRCFSLVNLCQGALNKCRSAAQNRYQPHPEHGSCSTDADSGGNTCNISSSHS